MTVKDLGRRSLFDVPRAVISSGKSLAALPLRAGLRRPGPALWLAVFLVAAVASAAFQLVFLPYVVPSWHAGHGLLVGGDWLGYHRAAVELAGELRERGWEAWELRPHGHAVLGITAAVYALTVPEPWALIPLNAGLHATAALVLFRLLEIFVSDRRAALAGVAPFALYPSAMTWYAQVLKDGYAVLGYLLFVYGWALLVAPRTWEAGWGWRLRSVLAIAAGTMLNWVVRPHIVTLMLAAALGPAVLGTIVSGWRAWRGRWHLRRALVAAALIWVAVGLIAVLSPVAHRSGAVTRQEMSAALEPAPRVAGRPPGRTAALGERASWPLSSRSEIAVEEALAALDTAVSRLGVVRVGYVLTYPDAGSNVDVDRRIAGMRDLLTYLPRAAAIAFLAPFPSAWFTASRLEPNTTARRLAGFEMIGVYLGLGGLLYGIARWRARAELYAVLLICGTLPVIYTVLVPNVGALYRLRYGFLMTLVGLGVAAAVVAWNERRVSYRPHPLPR
ncbi:MAG TPA: hypothetical protein VNI83_06505 [Vicinamibacterales bacterium]|nr:hypothetical protein [Vicinamibacterales bacterium]